MTTTTLATPRVRSPRTRTTDYPQLLSRLSAMSVSKAHDPFVDIAWDAPENRLEPDDPRLALAPDNPLACTRWYQELEPSRQVALSVTWLAQVLKYGIGFEAVLSRGLLQFAQSLPNRSLEYRYAMHEVVEEGRHSLMFQTLLERLGADPKPIGRLDRFFDDRIARTGRTFPELFLFAVLGGEIFIDQQNRGELTRPRAQVHPLVRRVMQIHVTEEARHVRFAESYLQEHLPQVGRRGQLAISLLVPLILSETATLMLQPTAPVVRAFDIPKSALNEAFGPNTTHRARIKATAAPVRTLCEEHGLYRPWLWHRMGLA